MREYIYSLMDIANATSILDVGCGDGYDLRQIDHITNGNIRLVGIDSSTKAVQSARSETEEDSRFSFLVGNVSSGLPFENEEFDVVFSINLLECVVDKDALVKEVHRVLRTDGQVVFAHFDWDSQLIDGEDKALVRRIVHTFGDWKQKWMTDCDSWMGRRLWRIFNRSGLFKGDIHTFALTNTEFSQPHYGYERIKDFEALVKQGLIQKEEYDTFYNDIVKLASKEEYFYSITMYIYVGRKIKLP